MTNDELMAKAKLLDHHSSQDDGGPWVVREEPSKEIIYDLEERTARFGEAIIDFAKSIRQNSLTNRIISQLVGAGTSVGANYIEADDSVSKKNF